MAHSTAVIDEIERFSDELFLPAHFMIVNEQALGAKHWQIVPRQHMQRLSRARIDSQATRRHLDGVSV